MKRPSWTKFEVEYDYETQLMDNQLRMRGCSYAMLLAFTWLMSSTVIAGVLWGIALIVNPLPFGLVWSLTVIGLPIILFVIGLITGDVTVDWRVPKDDETAGVLVKTMSDKDKKNG